MSKFPSCRPSLAAGLLLTALSPARLPAADPAPRPVVVLLSIDGLAGYYLDDPKADMPTLRQLAKEGARASSMKASTPTVTWTNHATLATGDVPARHGVIANNIYDRVAHRKIVLISDPELDAPQILKVPTIYEVAHNAGLKTIALRWPVTRAGKGLDEVIPDMTDDQILLKYSTPDLIQRGKAAGILGDSDFVPADPEKHPQLKDETVTRLTEMVLKDDHPDLLLVHLIEVDHTEHEHGPRSPEAYAAVHAADGFLKRIQTALEQAAPGRGTLVVVSDHGFSPIEHQILPNVVLRDAGLIKIVGVRQVKGDVANVAQGGADFIYVTDPAKRDTDVAIMKKAFSAIPGIRKTLTAPDFPGVGQPTPATDPNAPDLILLADEGYSFGDTSNGAIPVQDKPERKGSHGQDADLPDLHATFVAWGRGIRAGVNVGEIPNIDVAPTVAALLGIKLPDVDGKPVEKALLP